MTVEAESVVQGLRATFDSGLTRPLDWRLGQLRALGRMLVDRRSELEAALAADLGKPATESFVTEISFLSAEVDHTIRHLRRWLRPHRVAVPAVLLPASARTVLEPLGVALVIAPWNYPLMLSVSPLIGAIAAGNAVLLKPSEIAPATSAALADLLPRYLDSRAVAVVEGGIPETTEILAQRFDTIFYTGNGRVGRIVLEAAAKHLTPVTLELGGKSPAYVDDSVDLRTTAQRLVWGKYINAGQTCVAPDYVITTDRVAKQLVPLLAEAVREQFGDDPAASADYGRIVDERQYQRLIPLLGSGTISVGGDVDGSRRYIAPTVLTDVSPDSPVMSEEIFGPILPVVTVADEASAIAAVAARDKPLALYVFSNDKSARRRWLRGTSSGAVLFNAAVVHLSVPGLPFGGVGASGTGSYHGLRSVRVFSHEKAVLDKPQRPDTLALLRPPYTDRRRRIVDLLLGGLRRR